MMLKNLYPVFGEVPDHWLGVSTIRGYPMGMASNEDDFADCSLIYGARASGIERRSRASRDFFISFLSL
jgi:hypothetical protein